MPATVLLLLFVFCGLRQFFLCFNNKKVSVVENDDRDHLQKLEINNMMNNSIPIRMNYLQTSLCI